MDQRRDQPGIIESTAGCVGCLTGLAAGLSGAALGAQLGPVGMVAAGLAGFVLGFWVGGIVGMALPGAAAGAAIGWAIERWGPYPTGLAYDLGGWVPAGAIAGGVLSLLWALLRIIARSEAPEPSPAQSAPAALRSPETPGSVEITLSAAGSRQRHGSEGRTADYRGTCPFCLTALSAGRQTVTCRRCGIVYHAECWRENGGCSVYGCR